MVSVEKMPDSQSYLSSKQTNIWSTSAMFLSSNMASMQTDIISDILSIDVFPFVPECDADDFKALVIIDELDVIKCDAEARKDGYNDVMLAAIVIELTD
jgi:hypothetical protein